MKNVWNVIRECSAFCPGNINRKEAARNGEYVQMMDNGFSIPSNRKNRDILQI